MELKQQIIDLRNQGKSYREIQLLLGCSKGTIAYHCGENQKQKHADRQQKRRKIDVLLGRVESFQFRKQKESNIVDGKQSDKELLRQKTHNFRHNKKRGKISGEVTKFNSSDVVAKFGQQTKCYLSGRPIDLSKPRTYQFDHIVPPSRGGSNGLDNLGILSTVVNRAKDNMLVEEFVQLCKEVLEHQGFTVIKK